MRALVVVVLLVVTPTPARAQEATPAWPEGGRAAADWISTGAVVTQLAGVAITDWRSPDRAHLLRRDALRIGVAVAIVEVAKRVVHRTRPDGSDRMSFFSEHTELAVVASGWNISISVPLSMSTAYLRMAANKHWPTDVLVGALVGAGVSQVIR